MPLCVQNLLACLRQVTERLFGSKLFVSWLTAYDLEDRASDLFGLLCPPSVWRTAGFFVFFEVRFAGLFFVVAMPSIIAA